MATTGLEEELTIDKRKNEQNGRSNYWKKVVSHYEKRNASLERKQAALVERVRFMECALPSLVMGAVVNTKKSPDSSRNKISSCQRCSSSSFSSEEKSFTKLGETREHRRRREDEDNCRD